MTTKAKIKQYYDSTFLKKLVLTDSEGEAYTPSDNDKLVFHICQNFTDTEPLLEKEIDPETCVLYIAPTEWKDFPRNSSQEWVYGDYYYDIHWETVSEEGYVIHEPLQIGKFTLLNKVMDKEVS